MKKFDIAVLLGMVSGAAMPYYLNTHDVGPRPSLSKEYIAEKRERARMKRERKNRLRLGMR